MLLFSTECDRLPSVRTSLDLNVKNATLYKQHEEDKVLQMLQRKERRLPKLQFRRNSSLTLSETESKRLKRLQGEAVKSADDLDPEDDVGTWRGGKWRLISKAKEQELALNMSISTELLKMKQESEFIKEKLTAYEIRLNHFLKAHAKAFLKAITKECMRYIQSNNLNHSSSSPSAYALGVISAVCSSFKDPLFLELVNIRRAFDMLGIPISSAEEEDVRNLGNGQVIHLSHLCDYVVANAITLSSRSSFRRNRLLLKSNLQYLGLSMAWKPSECLLRDSLLEKERKRLVLESRSLPFKEPPRYATFLSYHRMMVLINCT